MFYILNDNSSYSKRPEIDYGNGTSMQFKRGLFLFDTDNTTQNFWVNNDGGYVELDADRFKITKNWVFNNKNKAELNFIRLKIDEMKSNGFEFFMPTSYMKFLNKYKTMIEEHPEYAI